ncbi:MAG: adenosine deaminase [Candidatus Acidiferrales bacterium]
MDLQRLPKIELHCHLDASVRVATVAEIGRELLIALPHSLEDALVAPETCKNLADYLCRIDLALEVMQRPQELRRIARELVEDFAADGVIYGEVRFAPQLHLRRGMSLQEVVDAVHAGLADGESRYNVRTGLILCCIRHEPASRSLEIAQLAVDNARAGKVCGLDLAGDEARYPGAPHARAFELARRAGLHRTVHAGEAAGAPSIDEALTTLFAERIGHGVRIEERADVVNRVRSHSITLEMCPKSNVQTRAVDTFEHHPISRLLRQGLRVTVSTDGRTISATSVTGELARLFAQSGWGLAEFWRCQRNAADAAFASPEIKEELLAKITAAELRADAEGK